MPFEIIRMRLFARPFMPFCVVTPSGDRYPVRHPEMAVATKSELAIALPDADGVSSRLQILSTLHVTAIEPLDPAPVA
jgi:hypothetical protein